MNKKATAKSTVQRKKARNLKDLPMVKTLESAQIQAQRGGGAITIDGKTYRNVGVGIDN